MDDSFFKFKFKKTAVTSESGKRKNVAFKSFDFYVFVDRFFFESANIALRIRWRMNFRNEFSGGSIEEKRERNIGEEFSACCAKKVNSGE